MYIFLYGRCGHRPLQLSIERTSSEFHTPNIQRAQTERLHGVPCDWEARSGGRPKGVPYGTCYRRMVRRSKMLFQARQRYFTSPAPFSSISFPARGKRYGPRSGGCGFANRTAPPAHSKAGLNPPHIFLAYTSRSWYDGACKPFHTILTRTAGRLKGGFYDLSDHFGQHLRPQP